MEAEAGASADRWRAASERHERERDALTAELAEARATIASAADKAIDDIEAARREGHDIGQEEARQEASVARSQAFDEWQRLLGNAKVTARIDGAQEERSRWAPVGKAFADLIYWAKRFESEPQGVGLDAVERALAKSRERAESVVSNLGIAATDGGIPDPMTVVEAERWRRHGARYALGYTAGEEAEREAWCEVTGAETSQARAAELDIARAKRRRV